MFKIQFKKNESDQSEGATNNKVVKRTGKSRLMLAEQKLDALEKGFDSFETRMNQHASLTRDLVIGIAVAMFITTVIIIIDYAHNRGDGYLKYIDKVDELQEGYYSKAEIDSIFNDYVSCKDVDGYHKCK